MITTEEKINQLSVMEQSIQQIINQKKKFQNQLLETESALNEVSTETYKIIGNFMFKKNSEELKKELIEKKELLKTRIRTYDEQEEKTEKRFKELQQQVLKELEKKGDK
ncbi:prefoldin subunit [Candidatus Woesearchaeota archaeon]|nr:prefoldin subunit [Candidatus Woesearchaeota archaeon]